MRKNPRIVKGASTNGYAGATRLLNHYSGSLHSSDVAVSDHGNVVHCLHHFANTIKVDGSIESLGSGPTVYEDGGYTRILESLGKVGCSEIFFVPSKAHFGRYGNVDCIAHCPNEGLCLREFGHHRGSPARLRYLWHGATHVDVYRGHADRFQISGRISHFLGHPSEKLNGERTVRFVGLD